jgi:acyl dehydratase
VQAPVGPEYASALTSELPLSHQMDFAAPADMGRRYGKVSGDINPIHLSALSAKLFGFRRAIAHGLWTNARALVALLPPTPLAQAEMTVEFKTPLYLPARASLWTTGEVRSALPGHVFPGNALFEVRNAAGDKPHLRGQIGYRTV